jgi:hypothetical protein
MIAVIAVVLVVSVAGAYFLIGFTPLNRELEVFSIKATPTA